MLRCSVSVTEQLFTLLMKTYATAQNPVQVCCDQECIDERQSVKLSPLEDTCSLRC